MKRAVGVGDEGRKSATRDEVIAGPRADLCLEFANTLAWRGRAKLELLDDAAPDDQLHNLDELLTWCVGAGCIAESAIPRMQVWSRKHPGEAGGVFRDAIELREVIYRIVARESGEDEAAREDLERFNQALAAAPPRAALGQVADRIGWRVPRDANTTATLLAPVLWSAADLLVGSQFERIRQCANPECLWLFLDDRKGGRRRWCSMQACGNRAKARRHYQRRKA